MASRALGAFFALAAAALFVVSIAASAFWAGYPVVDGKEIAAKHVHVGPLGATGCNVGGDGSCESIGMQNMVKLVGYGTAGATGLATLFAIMVLFAASRISERRKGVALASLVFTLLAAGGAGAMLAIGPGIEASQQVQVPIGWGTFVFGGGVLASLLASLATRKLEPEPLRLKPGRPPSARALAKAQAKEQSARSAKAEALAQAQAQIEAQLQAQLEAQTGRASQVKLRPSQAPLRPSPPRLDPPAQAQPPAQPPAAWQAPLPPREPSPVPQPPRQPSPQATWDAPVPQPPPPAQEPPSAPRTKAPSAMQEPVHAFARTKPPSGTHAPVNPFARTVVADDHGREPAATDPLMPSNLPGMPPVRTKPPSIAPPPKKPVVPAPPPRAKAPSAIQPPAAKTAAASRPAPAAPTSSSSSGALRPSTEQGPGTPPPERGPVRGSAPKLAAKPQVPAVRAPTVAHAVPPPPAGDSENDRASAKLGVPGAKPAAAAAARPGAVPAAKPGGLPAKPAAAPADRGPPKRRSDTEMRTGKNAIAEPTETGIDSGPAARAFTDSDLAEPPPPATATASADDTDAEAKPFSNGGTPKPRISEAELAKLVAQASAPDQTAQTLLAPEVQRRDPQDLMATMERNPRLPAPRTPIPTLERKAPPAIDPTERPVQVPLSTAPASLPPPKDLDAPASGPSPACPQCEAPMSWVDEHLRFYCRACRMYF